MEHLLDYTRRYCNEGDLYNYLWSQQGMLKKLGLLSSDVSGEDLRYYLAEYESLCNDFIRIACDTKSAMSTRMTSLAQLNLLYNRRFGVDIMTPFLNCVDKYRAEKAVNWRDVTDYMRFSVLIGELLGFETSITRANPSYKDSPMVVNMVKSMGCMQGYSIVVYTDYSYDEIKKYHNWVKVRSEIIKEFKDYQVAVRNSDLITGE